MTKSILLLGFLLGAVSFSLKGQNYQSKGTIVSTTNLINRCGNCSHEYYIRAKLNIEEGNKMDAMSDLNNAIKIHNEYFDKESFRLTEYYNERANLKLDLGDYRGAILDFDNAIGVGTGYSELWTEIFFGRAFCRTKLGDYEGAIIDYEKVLIHNPNEEVTHYNLGLIKLDIDKKDEGCLHLSKAGELGFSDAYKAIAKSCN
ncbi:tetratricopeptide repeat protein [Maribacter aestuarii]|uniref:tetratricopeptide repeat protein n=1 Tax=Maribacter aestuarii TaxID=1130723 RepID=UPI00248B8B88|nr:tetratricopeptide repeat protein [Maribacter aestuarii]